MGFKEAKYMMIIIFVVMAMCNIYALTVPELSSLGAGKMQGADINKFATYDNGKFQLGNDGSQFQVWVNSTTNQTVQDTTTNDFNVLSFGWIKSAAMTLFSALYAPVVITYNLIQIDGGEVAQNLWWIPYLIGIGWTIALLFTMMQILWRE